MEGVLAEESIADFTTITPLPMKLRPAYLKLKKAELEHEQRLLLRKKLAWFFAGRGTDDIPADDRVDPVEVTGSEETAPGASEEPPAAEV
jgi:hypothetical protein